MHNSNDAAKVKLRLTDMMCIVFGNMTSDIQSLEVCELFPHGVITSETLFQICA